MKGVRERLVPVGTAVAVTLSHVPSCGDGGIAVDQRRPASPPSAGPGVAEWTEPWCPASWGQIGPWRFSPAAALLRGRGHGRGWPRGHPGCWLAGVGATVSLELVGQPPGLSCRARWSLRGHLWCPVGVLTGLRTAAGKARRAPWCRLPGR